MNKQLLTELCCIDGPSGRENAVRSYILDKLNASSTPKEVQVDAMGNVLVHLIGKNTASKKVLFDAHMDEVGFVVTHIFDNGMLRFSTVGGILPQVLYGHRVRIGTQVGVIGGKAMHQCGGDESKKVPSADAMAIDIGAQNREEAKKLVKVGDFGTFDAGLNWLQDDLFVGKAVDDRVGCYLLLQLAEQQPKRDLWLSFTVQEELGCRGAGVAATAIQPDIAIAVEATTAGDIAGSSEPEQVCCMGKGAVVSFADRVTMYDGALYQRIRDLADGAGIPNQTKNKIAGGNNASAIQVSGTGVHMSAVSLPCRYIHSQACMGRVSDVEAMYNLLSLLAEELTQ
ncbi:MAG: M42 family peptidase [Clostridia bacterium]|nr:M42 family peptidase [Clostridia bacterium]